MLTLVVLVAGCRGGSDDAAGRTVPTATPPLLLDDVVPAVAAVETALGGPQRYTEINVQAELVNLFVAADDGTELAYVYRDGALEAPPGPTPQPEGAILFSLDGVSLDAVSGFDELLAAELPDSSLVRLSLSSAAAGRIEWTATLLGARKSPFDVVLSPAGQIIGALPR